MYLVFSLIYCISKDVNIYFVSIVTFLHLNQSQNYCVSVVHKSYKKQVNTGVHVDFISTIRAFRITKKQSRSTLLKKYL